MRVFLDTNVVIDFCAERKPFFSSAAKLIDMAVEKDIDIIISSLSFINVAYIMRKRYDKETVLEKLKSLAECCTVSRIDDKVILSAISAKPVDFEDCVQYESAKTENADVIITRDEKGFVDLGMAFMSPDLFIQMSQKDPEEVE